jgi:hypothetical protein
MSNTTHRAVRDALIAALLAAPALAGGRVVGNRRRPMAVQDPSQIYVFLEESVCTRHIIGTLEWQTRIRIECVARTVSGANSEDVADALAATAYLRIIADPTLGGTAVDTEVQGLAWTEDEADTALAACQQLLTVRHQTPDAHI